MKLFVSVIFILSGTFYSMLAASDINRIIGDWGYVGNSACFRITDKFIYFGECSAEGITKNRNNYSVKYDSNQHYILDLENRYAVIDLDEIARGMRITICKEYQDAKKVLIKDKNRTCISSSRAGIEYFWAQSEASSFTSIEYFTIISPEGRKIPDISDLLKIVKVRTPSNGKKIKIIDSLSTNSSSKKASVTVNYEYHCYHEYGVWECGNQI